MSKPAIDRRERLEELNGKLADLGMRGYWQLRRDSEGMEPKLWRWADIYPALMETAEVVRLGSDTFRRNVGLQTGSRTISMGFQIVLPGEVAPPHRHTNTALRFVIKGGGAYTTSNGEPMPMYPGDLLIQPNWAWHDHVNQFRSADHLDRRAGYRFSEFFERFVPRGMVGRNESDADEKRWSFTPTLWSGSTAGAPI